MRAARTLPRCLQVIRAAQCTRRRRQIAQPSIRKKRKKRPDIALLCLRRARSIMRRQASSRRANSIKRLRRMKLLIAGRTQGESKRARLCWLKASLPPPARIVWGVQKRRPCQPSRRASPTAQRRTQTASRRALKRRWRLSLVVSCQPSSRRGALRPATRAVTSCSTSSSFSFPRSISVASRLSGAPVRPLARKQVSVLNAIEVGRSADAPEIAFALGEISCRVLILESED